MSTKKEPAAKDPATGVTRGSRASRKSAGPLRRRSFLFRKVKLGRLRDSQLCMPRRVEPKGNDIAAAFHECSMDEPGNQGRQPRLYAGSRVSRPWHQEVRGKNRFFTQ